jgi:hypothetical protein
VRRTPTLAAALAALALAGCGDSGSGDEDTKSTTTPAQPAPAGASVSADTPLVRCLDSQSFITVKPGPGGVRVATTDKGERATIRTYDSLSDALRAGRKAGLDLDQIVSRQTITYDEPGTGQIKIAVETCT